MVIDDEADLAKLIKLNLERTGQYEVRTENNGSLGLVAAKEFKPDLILLDILIPDVDGGGCKASPEAMSKFRGFDVLTLFVAILAVGFIIYLIIGL